MKVIGTLVLTAALIYGGIYAGRYVDTGALNWILVKGS